MDALRAKLRSTSGASLLTALLLLLLLLMVGAVVLTAAASNVGRMSRQKAGQQDYLTVSSAARLLREGLEGLSYTTGEEQVTDHGPEGGTSASYRNAMPAGDTLESLVQKLAEGVFRRAPRYVPPTGSSPAPEMLTVSAANLGQVSVELAMGSDYGLTARLTLTDRPDSYRLVLNIPVQVEDTEESSVSTYEVTVTEPVEGVPTEITYTYEIRTVTRTLSLVWQQGEIWKEG